MLKQANKYRIILYIWYVKIMLTNIKNLSKLNFSNKKFYY